MASITIQARVEWSRETGSGENCMVCGDACFLSEWRGIILTGRGILFTGEREIGRFDAPMCAACGDELMEVIN